jgi:hypothetical protein
MIRRISQTASRMGWPACYVLVFVSAFSLSGTRQPPLELDPSWEVAIEHAAVHHLQFGTQIVFTFGPLGFLASPFSLRHLAGARIAFALFWSALVALTATTLARGLRGWVRYTFITWMVVFTLSEGLDQTAFFVMTCGTLLLLFDTPKQRWLAPFYVLAFIILSLTKFSFLTAAFASFALVILCWIWQGKLIRTVAVALGAPVGLLAFWIAVGQSPFHLAAWLRHGLELESGYSGAMSLVPKTGVVCAALAGLALFAGALIATIVQSHRNFVFCAAVLTIAQYTFLAWKEGFTRSGDWHCFVFLWYLPLGLVFLLGKDLQSGATALHRGVMEATFAAAIAMCLVGAHFQIPGFAWRLLTNWPQRISLNAQIIFGALAGHSKDFYAECSDPKNLRMLVLDHANDVIGNESVDVMNYLLLPAVTNEMNYEPRPVIQGFVAYTPVLQNLNEEYFRSIGRPRFVMLCQEATDGRFPALEDSAATNYVLNNYVPVGRDGRFLILQQRTADEPRLQLVHERMMRFGETLDLRPWAHGPLFMSVKITPSLLGKAVTLIYQEHPLYVRVESDNGEAQYRVVPSMAQRPFLLSPVIDNNRDVMNLYAAHPGNDVQSLTLNWPGRWSFEFDDRMTVRLYAAPDFPHAAGQIPVSRMLADVQGRVFWPEPLSVVSASPARLTVIHGTAGLLVRAPSKIVLEIPPSSSSFSGYFGLPGKAFAADNGSPAVDASILVQDRSGETKRRLDRPLQRSTQADSDERFPFRVPIDSTDDRTITLATSPGPGGDAEAVWSIWSQCRFDQTRTH